MVIIVNASAICSVNKFRNQPDKNSKSMRDFHADEGCRTLVCAILRHGLCCTALQKT